VRLVANTDYWDKARGPRVREVVFRNDVSPQRALELVCTTEGEVDIVTEVAPADAARVERSEHAKLVSIDAMRAVVGIINRDAEGLPLADRRVRRALNLAVDREALVREAMCGRARPLAGLTPPTPLTLAQLFPDRLGPYPHDAARAATLWPAAGGAGSRPLRIATMEEKLERVARAVAADLRAALGLDVEVTVYRGEEELRARRRLAEKERPRAWDVFILEQGTQTADAPTLELHRAVVGETGEYRAGPVVPAFEALYAEFTRQTSQVQLALMANRIDRFVYNQDLALFLCAPRALYAVNKHVQFNAYRTTLELAETTVDEGHWSRRNGSGGTAPAQSEPASSGPSATGFHGAGC
jgi:ABC-type transport system substrate-binding protein